MLLPSQDISGHGSGWKNKTAGYRLPTGCHACGETASDFLFQCPVAASHDLSDRIAYLALVDYDVHDPFPFHKTVDQPKRNCLAGLFPDVSNINKTYDQTMTKIWQMRIEKRIV